MSNVTPFFVSSSLFFSRTGTALSESHVLIRGHYGIFSWLVLNVKAEIFLLDPDFLVCLPQSLQTQIIMGHKHLHDLLCHAVQASVEATEEEK